MHIKALKSCTQVNGYQKNYLRQLYKTEIKMKFEEIFNEDGQYTCDSFVEGFCLEIRDGMMFGIYYDHKDDLCPIINIFGCNKSMLKNDYRKVFTRQSLFKSGKIVTN